MAFVANNFVVAPKERPKPPVRAIPAVPPRKEIRVSKHSQYLLDMLTKEEDK